MAKNKPWFWKVRQSYLPASWQGLAIYLIYAFYLVVVNIIWYQGGHQPEDWLLKVLPIMVAAAFLTQFVASKNSK